MAKFAAIPIEKQKMLTTPVVTAVRTVRTIERGGAGVCWRGRSIRFPAVSVWSFDNVSRPIVVSGRVAQEIACENPRSLTD